MKEKFMALGVSPAKDVVIYGGWNNGWGDEGRIHWMLKSLGHKNTFILSGGLAAYTMKFPDTSLSTTAYSPTAVNKDQWLTGLDTTGFESIVKTKEGIASTDLLVDTRTEAEYTGELGGSDNYGVARDGHAKGAVRFTFGDFFSGTCLKTCDAFKADLTSRGWTKDKKLVAYCTAGIRSAFFWSLAAHCVIDHVSNYGGSMWEWAADNSKEMATTFACTDYTVSTVFKSPAWLQANLASVTVLDARGATAYEGGHLASAANAVWQTFTMGCPGTTCGVLNTPQFIKEKFMALGVRPTKDVVIYGAWNAGWGDEGRIHWMLKSLGHKNTFILAGGLAAYTAKYPNTALSTTAYAATAVSADQWSSGLDVTGFEDIVETKASIKATDMLIDTRTEAEYT